MNSSRVWWWIPRMLFFGWLEHPLDIPWTQRICIPSERNLSRGSNKTPYIQAVCSHTSWDVHRYNGSISTHNRETQALIIMILDSLWVEFGSIFMTHQSQNSWAHQAATKPGGGYPLIPHILHHSSHSDGIRSYPCTFASWKTIETWIETYEYPLRYCQ